MKVAFVTWKFPALANTFILNEIVEVKKRGHDLAIYSLERSQDEVVHDDVERFGLLQRTFYLDDFIAERLPGDPALQRYQDDWLNDRVHAIPPLARKLRQDGVDVVHGCFCNNSATVAMLLGRLADIPFGFECHAHDLFVDLRHGDEKLREAARIFPISDYNRRHLIEQLHCAPQKIRVRRVPINKTSCDAIQAQPRDPGLVTFVGRLHPIKGLQDALSAFAVVAADMPAARFCIIGDGELRQPLQQRAAALGLGERVEFAGNMTNERALQRVARSAAFLLPSVITADGDRDGIPTSIIEAMYLRTPVVSTAVSGIPELIEDGVDGCLSPPGDVAAIAGRLRSLLADAGLRAKMGERARQRVDLEFDSDRNIDILLREWQAMRQPASVLGRLKRFLLRQ